MTTGEWIDVLKLLGVSSVPAALILAATIFLGKRFVEHLLARSVELKKLELDKDLEQFKSELQRATASHEIRFAKLHAEQADAIVVLYERLSVLESAMLVMTSMIQRVNAPPKSEQAMVAVKAAADFLEFYVRKEILLPPKVCAIIDDIFGEYKKALLEFTFFPPDSSAHDFDEALQKAEFWRRAGKRTNEKVPPLKQQLKTELQRLLGVEEQL
jgi:hypothetical protein